MKYYGVAMGRKTGVFTNWEEVKSYVTGFKGAKYQSFGSLEQAEKYVSSGGVVDKPQSQKVSFAKDLKSMCRVYAEARRDTENGKFIVSGIIDSSEGIKEVVAWSWLEDYPELSDLDLQCYAYINTLKEAFHMGCRDVVIVYKNDCIKGWGESWKARSEISRYYKSFIQAVRLRLNSLYFEKYDSGSHYHMKYKSEHGLSLPYKSENYTTFGYTGSF